VVEPREIKLAMTEERVRRVAKDELKREITDEEVTAVFDDCEGADWSDSMDEVIKEALHNL